MHRLIVASSFVVAVAGCDVVFTSHRLFDASVNGNDGSGPGDAIDGASDSSRDDALTTAHCQRQSTRLCITFDDDLADGIALDQSSQQNDADVTNVTVVERRPGAPAVAVGAESDIAIAMDNGLDLPGPLTFAMWIRYTSTTPDASTTLDNDIQFGITLDEEAQRVSCVAVESGSLSPKSVGFFMSRTQWHHVACVKTNSSLIIYIDGIQRNFITFAGQVHVGNNNPVRIGQDSQSSGPQLHFVGELDDVMIFDEELGDTAIGELYSK